MTTTQLTLIKWTQNKQRMESQLTLCGRSNVSNIQKLNGSLRSSSLPGLKLKYPIAQLLKSRRRTWCKARQRVWHIRLSSRLIWQFLLHSVSWACRLKISTFLFKFSLKSYRLKPENIYITNVDNKNVWFNMAYKEDEKKNRLINKIIWFHMALDWSHLTYIYFSYQLNWGLISLL